MPKATPHPAPHSRAEADAFLIYVTTQFAPALSGGLAVLQRLVDEMTAASERMDEGGTVLTWAGMIALVHTAFEQPNEDLAACIQDRKLAGAQA